MHPYDYIPWLGSLFFELILVFFILKHTTQKRFPVFFAYIIFDILRAIILPTILYAMPQTYTYFYAYWLSVPIEYTLTFLIILEVFAYIFRTHIVHGSGVIRAFVIFAFVVFLASVVLILGHELPFTKLSWIILIVNRSIALLASGLLFFMWAYSSRIGFSMRDHVWGIVFGLGAYSSVSLIVAAVHAATGQMCPGWITPLPHFAYLGSTIIWNAYLFREEPAITPMKDSELAEYHGFLRSYKTLIANVRKARAR